MASLSISALNVAAAMGHRHAGEEHVLIAWLEAELPPEQRQALDALGLTGPRTRAALVASTGDANQRQSGSGTSSGPTYHRSRGRIRGLAVAAGRPAPSTDDVIRGCLMVDGPATDLLADLGRTRMDVLVGVPVSGGPIETPPSDTLSEPATREAVGVDSGYVGSWHFVLALLADRSDGPAGDALRACGITHAGYGAWLTSWIGSARPPAAPLAPGSSPTMSTAGHELLGRAEGLAAADGSPLLRSRHGVLAWLWQDYGQAVAELEGFGTTTAALLEALAQRGVDVPSVPVPEPDRRQWGESVHFPVDRLGDVLALLRAELEPGDWGWNCHGDEAWADAIAGIDLQALVADALGPDES